uniref:Glycosyltransferase n=1 Tax=viral metagenome TaxID=1070528 RepID=A0A6C0F873_9ZZZZ|tara:strand:- start:22254 stop:22976 length:723 start_codon:yes stop_codon:yes gene_type:complete
MKYNFAICYFGLSRSIKHVYESHITNIFDVLKDQGFTYKIFMHTWKTKDNIQRVWQNTINERIDYDEYKLLNPDQYKIESQDEFLSNINMNNYYYGKKKQREWVKELLVNHICALESQMRVYNMMINDQNTFNNVIIIRPDSKFNTPLPINNILPLKEKEFMISDYRHYEGLNDRFCICSKEDSHIYMCRLKQMKDYRKIKSRITAESYLQYILNSNNCDIKKIKWNFDLVRPDGSHAIH